MTATLPTRTADPLATAAAMAPTAGTLRRRSPAMVSLGIILVVVCALAAWEYVSSSGPATRQYLAVYRRGPGGCPDHRRRSPGRLGDAGGWSDAGLGGAERLRSSGSTRLSGCCAGTLLTDGGGDGRARDRRDRACAGRCRARGDPAAGPRRSCRAIGSDWSRCPDPSRRHRQRRRRNRCQPWWWPSPTSARSTTAMAHRRSTWSVPLDNVTAVAEPRRAQPARRRPRQRRLMWRSSCCARPRAHPVSPPPALALTLVWPRPVLLVEADPAGGDVMAGYLRGQVTCDRGLLQLAIAARHGRLAEEFNFQLINLNRRAPERPVCCCRDDQPVARRPRSLPRGPRSRPI